MRRRSHKHLILLPSPEQQRNRPKLKQNIPENLRHKSKYRPDTRTYSRSSGRVEKINPLGPGRVVLQLSTQLFKKKKKKEDRNLAQISHTYNWINCAERATLLRESPTSCRRALPRVEKWQKSGKKEVRKVRENNFPHGPKPSAPLLILTGG